MVVNRHEHGEELNVFSMNNCIIYIVLYYFPGFYSLFPVKRAKLSVILQAWSQP